MAETLTNNGLGVPGFDLSQHIVDDRTSAKPHVDEEGGVTVGAFSRLAFEKQTPYMNPNGYHEYPKCVTFGSFSGVAKDATHEAQLKAKHAPSAPPSGQGNQNPVRPAGVPGAQRN